MYSEINVSLDAISRKLYRSSLNYSVNFRFFVSKETAGEPLETVLRTLLGDNAEVGNAHAATESDVIDELKDALGYRGDWLNLA